MGKAPANPLFDDLRDLCEVAIKLCADYTAMGDEGQANRWAGVAFDLRARGYHDFWRSIREGKTVAEYERERREREHH